MKRKSLNSTIIWLVTLLMLSGFSSMFIKTVSADGSLTITVEDLNNGDILEGDSLLITVTLDGEAVQGASVKLENCVQEIDNTNSCGHTTARAPSVDQDQLYTITASYEDHTGSEEITVFHQYLKISVSPATVLEGTKNGIGVTVTDKNDWAIQNAKVKIEGKLFPESTDQNGIVSFDAPEILDDAVEEKTFDITASYTTDYCEYDDGSAFAVVKNRYLKINVEPPTVNEGEKFTVHVTDQSGSSIETSVYYHIQEIPRFDGLVPLMKKGSSVTWTAHEVGVTCSITITAELKGYTKASSTINIINIRDYPVELYGSVIDNSSLLKLKPIKGATLCAKDSDVIVDDDPTDNFGLYRLRVWPGAGGATYTVTVEADGYKSQTFDGIHLKAAYDGIDTVHLDPFYLDKIEPDKTKNKPYTNTPFLNFLQNHLLVYQLLQRLLNLPTFQ